MSSTVFVDDGKKKLIREWYDRFRRKVPVPTEDITVDTSFGKTHVLVAGPKDAPPLIMLHTDMRIPPHARPDDVAGIRSPFLWSPPSSMRAFRAPRSSVGCGR